MSTLIIGLVAVAAIIGIVMLHKGWVKSELEQIHNRINGANSELNIGMMKALDYANNAKAIASNALSSAQRAESKFVKHIEETVTTKTTEGDTKNG